MRITTLILILLPVIIFSQQKLVVNLENATLNGKSIFGYSTDEISSLLGRPTGAKIYGDKKMYEYYNKGIEVWFHKSDYVSDFKLFFHAEGENIKPVSDKIVNITPYIDKETSVNNLKTIFRDQPFETYFLFETFGRVHEISFRSHKITFRLDEIFDFVNFVYITKR